MDIKIRPYQIDDTQSILDIINYNILHSTSLYDYTTRSLEQQKAIFADKLSKNFPILIAENKGTVLGFGMYGEFRLREAFKFTVEHSIYVSENQIGKGIGKLLLSELIDIAKTQGLHTMIGVIDSENQSSITFHEKFGFKIVGNIKESGFKFDRWLDSILVQLILE